MLHPRLVLALVSIVALAGCTDEGEGSLTATGGGIAIPWWVLLAAVLGIAALVWLATRKRR